MLIRWKRLSQSFVYATKGLKKVLKEEQNFRIELFIGAIVLLVAVVIPVSISDLAILVLVIALVLCLEIVNSVAELISDAVRPKLDYYAKAIKDVVAAGVLLASVTSIVIGVLIFGKYFF